MNDDFINFESVEEFIDLLRIRQKTLAKYRREAKTEVNKRVQSERIEEVDHFIDLIKHSNLTIKNKTTKPTKKANGVDSSDDETPRKKYSPPKGKEPGEDTKKYKILVFIRQHPDTSAKEVAAGLGFAENSVSAHMHALRASQLIKKTTGGFWKAVK